MKKIKFKISSFNKHLIFSISFLFLYLFYLSIPSLYDKGKLQKELTEKILNEFKINISISSDINYSILPSPNIVIKNVKIFNDDIESPKELTQIKKLKIFISQKSILNQKNLRINEILIEDANFSVQFVDFKFFKNYFETKLSKKKVKIKNSKVFFKDKKNGTISLFSISNLDIFYDEKKSNNNVNAYGNVFKIPFKLKWNKDFKNISSSITLLKLKRLRIEMKNISKKRNGIYFAENNLIIGNSKLFTKYKIDDGMINIYSEDTDLINNDVNYLGKISLNPFDLKLDINLKELDIKKFLKSSSVFVEFLKSNLFFNKNLSSTIILNSENIIKNKLFNYCKIIMNYRSGEINFNNSYLVSDKVGILNLYSSSLNVINEEMVFTGRFKFEIRDQEGFYRVFQISKSTRKPVTNIFFDINFNLFNNEITIKNFQFNELKYESSDAIKSILNEYNNNEKNKNKNWIDIKNFTNKLFRVYEG